MPITPTEPRFLLGQQFTFESRRGKSYKCTFIYSGPGVSGLVIRFSNNRLGRLNRSSVVWASVRPLEARGEALLAEDEVRVDTPTTSIRGRLAAIDGDELSLELASGPRRVPIASVIAIHLLFPASELLVGDKFVIRSQSGREYRGEVLSANAKQRLEVLTDSGNRQFLRLARLDMNSLFIPVPIPLAKVV